MSGRRNLPNFSRSRSAVASTSSYSGSRPSKSRYRETKAEYAFRKSVLKHFKCPFNEEGFCKHEKDVKKCLFAHPNQPDPSDKNSGDNKVSPKYEGDVKDVPLYACVYNLVNSCINQNINVKQKVNSMKSMKAPKNVKTINSCSSGLHLRPEDLVDLENFEILNAELIANIRGERSEGQCGICLDDPSLKRFNKNRRYGILQNCNHRFCENCIAEWRSRSNNQCPVCRKKSNWYLSSKIWIEKEDEKKLAFIRNQRNIVKTYGELESFQPMFFDDNIFQEDFDDFFEVEGYGDGVDDLTPDTESDYSSEDYRYGIDFDDDEEEGDFYLHDIEFFTH
ncbi:hypothetical protein RDWZM_003531 [Blomia tropicalis]|uniref:RING-type domain-containing protein n=1 Tax=Blomia tropicalis TaxID=40697 RepID=A0A9Q0MFK4_BLOTA|nr:hypothetical protein RDWZM_003531 [Blomia tropicalis]